MERIAPMKITKGQREWLEKEQERTGNSFASIVRNLIQINIDRKEDNKQ